jgi:hypothetical protein
MDFETACKTTSTNGGEIAKRYVKKKIKDIPKISPNDCIMAISISAGLIINVSLREKEELKHVLGS